MKKTMIAAAALATMSANVQSQPVFDQLVVFGDSLLDTGNAGILVSGGAITDQRFTNRQGPTFSGIDPTEAFNPNAIDVFAEAIGVPQGAVPSLLGGTNFAVGGDTTVDVLEDANNLLNDNFSFSSNSIALLDGGGNDLAAFWIPAFLTGGADAATAAVGESVQRFVDAITILDGLGAESIFVSTVPDLGAIPNTAPFGDLQEDITGLSTLFNVQVAASLNQLDANIVPLDLEGFVSALLADPERFGYDSTQDLAATCFDGSGPFGAPCAESATTGISSANPDPNSLIFFDGLHPTAITTARAGLYIADIVNAPRQIALLSQASLGITRNQLQVTQNELRKSRWDQDRTRWFVAGDFGFGDTGDDLDFGPGISAEGDATNISGTVGFVHPATDNHSFGVSITIGSQELEPGISSFESRSIGLTGLYGYRSDRFIVDASVGFTSIDYDDLTRRLDLIDAVIEANSETNGFVFGLDALAAFNVLGNSSNFVLAPAVGIQYAYSDIDGFTESGGLFSNYAFSDIVTDSAQIRYGLIAEFGISESLRIFGEVFGSNELQDDVQNIEVTNTNLSFNPYQLPGFEPDGDVFIKGTLGADLSLGDSSVNLVWNYSDFGEGNSQVILSYTRPF